MTEVRLTSAAAPFDRAPVRPAATRLVYVAGGLGLLPDRGTVERLDTELINDIARSALQEGVAREAAFAILERSGSTTSRTRWGDLLTHLGDALEGSPMPRRELTELLRTYGHEGLGSLLDISPASLRRYASGTREAPDIVAARIHFVALVTTHLAGSYNAFGLRRWWERPRTALDGRSPREALGRDWDPDEPAARAVAALAAALSGAGAAT